MAYGLEFKPFCGYRSKAHLREIRRRFVSEILVPVSSSERGGMRALSKADCGRTDRFSRDLLLFSRLAALEDCLFRQGTRRHEFSRRRRRPTLLTLGCHLNFPL